MIRPAVRICTVSVCLLAGAAWAAPVVPTAPAQPAQEFGPKTQVNDPCLKEVSRFEQTIGFLRNSQGVAAAAALKEQLLPAKLEADLLSREGYCGLAKYLRDRKLID